MISLWRLAPNIHVACQVLAQYQNQYQHALLLVFPKLTILIKKLIVRLLIQAVTSPLFTSKSADISCLFTSSILNLLLTLNTQCWHWAYFRVYFDVTALFKLLRLILCLLALKLFIEFTVLFLPSYPQIMHQYNKCVLYKNNNNSISNNSSLWHTSIHYNVVQECTKIYINQLKGLNDLKTSMTRSHKFGCKRLR